MRLAVLLSASLILASVAVAGEVRHSESNPAADGLRSYVAPKVDDATLAITGTYSFDVEVMPNGDIGTIQIDPRDSHGPDALGKLAREWKFLPFGGTSSRWRRLTFVFEQIETMEESRVETWYESPLTLHTQRFQCILWRQPRINGQVAEKVCLLHNETMHIEVLPIRYMGYAASPGPLWESPPADPRERAALEAEFVRATIDQFPNAATFVLMGCVVGPQKFAEVFICPSCKKARQAWISAHEVFTPPN